MKRNQLAPRKVTELMLINLNEEAVKKYKSEHKLAKKYSGPTDLFKYEDVLSFERFAEDQEDSFGESESESKEEEVWTDDEEWLP